jgi:hypothetical protein
MNPRRKEHVELGFVVALLAGMFVYAGYHHVRSAPERHADERRQAVSQAIENAQLAENRRVASKCPTSPFRVYEACLSLVTSQLLNQELGKPAEFCKNISFSKDEFDSCMSDQKIQGAEEACAVMVHDPDLAPACRDITTDR